MQQIAAKFGEQIAFAEPEILRIEKATLDKWIAQEPRLQTYRHYLDDIQRRRPHTLSDAEERLLAASSLAAGTGSSAYNIFSNADFPYPTVTLSDGKSVKLDASAFSLYRGVPNREDRKKVMDAFFSALGQYKGTFEFGIPPEGGSYTVPEWRSCLKAAATQSLRRSCSFRL